MRFKARILIFLILALASSGLRGEVLTTNPSFENGFDGWFLHMDDSIAKDSKIELHPEIPGFTEGKRHVLMALSGKATDNQSQYITLGQNLNLSAQKRYRYSVKVRWNNPENRLPSAIVSIWIKNKDGNYSGRDEWLTSDEIRTLEFEFSPTADGPVFCYINLLTHQEGFGRTEILVDSFEISELGEKENEPDPRPSGTNLLSNSTFNDRFEGWVLTENNPQAVAGLKARIESTDGNPRLCLDLPAAHNNTHLNDTWSGVFQPIKLYAGNTYRLRADIERLVPAGTEYETIVNFFARKPTNPQTWLGTVDYKFNRKGPHRYEALFTPPVTTTYEITTRVFGWGNEGRPVSVCIDDLELRRIGEEQD